LTRIYFHQKLEMLRDRLLEMAGVAEQTLRLALDAQRSGEVAMCSKVRSNELVINRSEREIDRIFWVNGADVRHGAALIPDDASQYSMLEGPRS
jgi:hypothetical protein